MAKASGKRRGRKKVGPTRSPLEEKSESRDRTLPHLSLRSIILLALASGVMVLLAAGGWHYNRTRIAAPEASEPSFVGSQSCAGCHQAETRLWQASQHRHAMDHANEQSVRGDFQNTVFDYQGIRSRFFRKGEKFLVETDGADGNLATFQVKYTFGVDPLQQYLIEFPDGRIQALSIAWDTRPREQGGQRWFHLYPDSAVTHKDVLHWTKLHQNWNFMCAECHSTGVRKNYDAAKDQFATTFAEISVGCEACHGAGSRHVTWATGRKSTSSPARELTVKFDERTGITWSYEGATLTPKRSAPAPALRKEVETCGRCHARRGVLSENWTPGRPLLETHRVSLLDRQRFHADGQMRDDEETYNYALFKQSKMFSKGVTCSDCHDPHSARLKAPGDGVCAQCHAPERYQSAAHHHHAEVSPPPGCASCHMPERRYMVVDRRHDHGFRIPRPDLSAQTDVPNACNDCHRDKSAAWAAQTVEAWFGPRRQGYQGYAAAFHAAWSGAIDAQALLAAVAGTADAPGIARASAIAELPAPDLDLVRSGLSDPDPLVRLGALDGLEAVPADRLWTLASAQLGDPVLAVRVRAAELLASVPSSTLTKTERDAFSRAAVEFKASQQLNADRPEARTALGSFAARQGYPGEAETEYRAALRLDPLFSAAAINLADLYRSQGRDGDGARLLREAIAGSAQDASLHHALGLTLVRMKQPAAALDELRRAAELEPERARYGYVHAVALHSLGRPTDALGVLKGVLQRHPNDRETLAAALSFSREAGDARGALQYAEALAKLAPDDAVLAKLIEELRR